MESITEILKIGVALMLTAQCSYCFSLLLIGNTLLDYYEWGIFEKPKHWLPKTTNFILKGIFGLGPYLYKRLQHHSWLFRKLIFFIWTNLVVAGSFLSYLFISFVLDLFY
ncbi:hypothetical protein [Metabacillus sp. FJAT-52054]|uniref:DUF1294 domain-containing protein n=1 Tax=Metabacillus sediminis TaxID=3117746 RepID=A0ABZ2NFW6_9BACI